MAAVEDVWLLRKSKNGSGIIHFLIQRNHHGTVVVYREGGACWVLWLKDAFPPGMGGVRLAV